MDDKELIEAVAKEVMGWSRQRDYWLSKNNKIFGLGWNPLTNANHRDMVMERMRELGFKFLIGNTDSSELYRADFWKDPSPYVQYYKHRKIGHAVCLAAREAVRGANDRT